MNKKTQPKRPASPQKADPESAISRRTWLTMALGGTALSAGVLAYWWKNRPNELSENIRRYTYEIVHEFPHDANAFTQGLIYDNGFLYEGTGQYGESNLRKVELETGRVIQQSKTLPNQFFGEGITLWGDVIIQLTWENGIAFVYDKETFAEVGQFDYRQQGFEGWGLTGDENHLILSDGTANLRFLNPETFEEVRRITVHNDLYPQDQLNELEYIDGEIYANRWHRDYILRISPETGEVLSQIDLQNLRPQSTYVDREYVLNGIAYDEDRDRLFVTGKRWPKLFEIRMIPERPE